MKHFCKKSLSLFLSLMMVFSVFSVIGVAPLTASAQITSPQSDDNIAVKIVVPETIYMAPSSGRSTSAQYYINNTLNGTTITTDSGYSTTGKIYFYHPGTNVTNVTVSASSGSSGTVTGSYSLTKVSSTTWQNSVIGSLNLSTGVAAGSTDVITWKFTVTYSSHGVDTTEDYYAYTTVYSPYLTPVGSAARVKYSWGSHTNRFLQSMIWISGIHSGETSYNMGEQSLGSGTKYVGHRYAQDAKLIPLLNRITTSNEGKTAVSDWLSTSAQSINNRATIAYTDNEMGKNTSNTIVTSSRAFLTVDTSRFSNLSQIPNVTVGYMITDAENSTKTWWYVSDITGTSQGYMSGNVIQNNMTSTDNTENPKPEWWTNFGTVIASGGDYINWQNPYGGASAYANKVLYNGVWNRAISSSVTNQLYYLKGAAHSYCDASSNDKRIYEYTNVALQLTLTDKTALRNLVQQCYNSGYAVNMFQNGGYPEYLTALKNAANALGDPTKSDYSAEKTALENAYNKLNTGVRTSAQAVLSHYGYVRVLDSLGNTTSYMIKEQLPSDNDSVTFYSNSKLTYSANSYDSYTYAGQKITDGTVSVGGSVDASTFLYTGSDTFVVTNPNTWRTLDKRNLTFFYKANDITVTIDPAGGVWNGTSSNSSVTASVGSAFTPAAPTRSCHTFAGWTLTVDGGGTYGDGTLVCGSSNATLTALWTEIPNEHTWEETGVVQEPTCTETGLMVYKCSKCGVTKNEPIETTPHNYADWTYVSGEGDAQHVGTCVDCGAKITENCSFTTTTVAPTCTEQGYDVNTCSKCGYAYTDNYVDENGHTWVEVEVTTEPTCDSTGERLLRCSVCGAETTELLPQLKHDYEMTTVAPTCVAEGYDLYTCKLCGGSYKDKFVAPTGHSYTEEIVAPTCTEQGYTLKTCTVCSEDTDGHQIKTSFTNATGHTWEDTETLVPPTCTVSGTKRQTCSVCGATQVVEALPTGHEYGDWTPAGDGTHYKECVNCTDEEGRTLTGDCSYVSVYTEPTCTEKGYTTYTCTECAHTYTVTDEDTPLKEHTYVDYQVLVEAGCTTTGIMLQRCSVCREATRQTEIPAKGHVWGNEEIITPATCETDGLMAATCTVCHEHDTGVVISALGHDKIVDVEAQAATCLVDGHTEGWHCSRCDYAVESETVAAPGSHDVVIDVEAKAPTCTEAGWTQGSHCSRCDEATVVSEPLDIVPHSYVSTVVPATCTTGGYTTNKCSVCADSYISDEIAALGHLWDEGTVITEGDCTTATVIEYKCTRDGCTQTRTETIPAAGHKWNAGVVIVAATCETEGVREVTCTECSFTTQIPIPKTNHSYIDVVYPPTCQEEGYTLHICENCGYEFRDTPVPAAGHTYEVGIVEPTCDTPGYTRYSCKVCGFSYRADIVPALGHNYIYTVVDPDCTHKGYTEYTCTVCGKSHTGDFMDALGHDYVVNVVPPTCTSQGYTQEVCTRCGNAYKHDFVDPIGHNFVHIETVPSTNTMTGYKLYRCENCGGTYKEMLYKDGKALVCITIYDDKGNPLTEAKVTIYNKDTEESYVIYTDLNGYFTEVMPEGDYELLIEKDHYEDCYGYITVIGGEATIDMPVVPHRVCDCLCHQDNIFARFFKLFARLFKLFGFKFNCCECSEIY